MPGLTREKPNQFRIRFAELERGVLDRLRPVARVVDPYLVCRAVVEVMRQASMRSAAGRLLVWNEYRIVMAPADLEPLRALERRLRGDLETALAGEARRLQAEVVGDVRVELVADEGGELAAGEAVIRADFAAEKRGGDSQMTVWLSGRTIMGEIDTGSPEPAGATVAVPDRGHLVAAWQGGTARLPPDVRSVLGRPHAGVPDHFVALSGASARISKQQLWIQPGSGGGAIAIGRFERANPVEVGGALVQAGHELRVESLPVEVSLSRGDLVILLSRS